MLLNCDMGEELTPSPDALVMPYIDLANIACGGHAGDEKSMLATVKLAKRHHVRIGAHPAYPDKVNFGRKRIEMPAETLASSLVEQIQNLQKVCDQHQVPLHHVKPHGALYLEMMKDLTLFDLIIGLMQKHFSGIPLMMQGGIDNRFFEHRAQNYQVPILFEAFADRAYQANGHLAPRNRPNSLFQNIEQIHQQVTAFEQIDWVHTVCFHSDNPTSVTALKTLKALSNAD